MWNVIAETKPLRDRFALDQKPVRRVDDFDVDDIQIKHISDEPLCLDPFTLFATRLNMA